ncbi:uncharacterized protein KIAA1671 homolog [Anolis carolinensis]|uniref:uncharacterized protein KIAA1671 homolog n=1 Tax=Anolis carolinensis TaxID=28377 RepID=UPI002F2B49F5
MDPVMKKSIGIDSSKPDPVMSKLIGTAVESSPQKKSGLIDTSKPDPVANKLIGVDSSQMDPVMKKFIGIDSSKPDPIAKKLIGVDSSKPDPIRNKSIGIDSSKSDPVMKKFIGVDSSKPDPVVSKLIGTAVESSPQKKSGLIDTSKPDPVANKLIGVDLSQTDPVTKKFVRVDSSKPDPITNKSIGIDSSKTDPSTNKLIETSDKSSPQKSGLIDTSKPDPVVKKFIGVDLLKSDPVTKKFTRVDSSKQDPVVKKLIGTPVESSPQKKSGLIDSPKPDPVKSEIQKKPSILIESSSKMFPAKNEMQQPSGWIGIDSSKPDLVTNKLIGVDSSKQDPIQSEMQKKSSGLIGVDRSKLDPVTNKFVSVDSPKQDPIVNKFETRKSVPPENKGVELLRKSGSTDRSKPDPVVNKSSSEPDPVKNVIQKPFGLIGIDPSEFETRKSVSLENKETESSRKSRSIDSSDRDPVQNEASRKETSESRFADFPVSPDTGNVVGGTTKATNVQQRIKELTAENVEVKPGHVRRSFRSRPLSSELTKLFSSPSATTETRAESSTDLTRKYNMEAQEVLPEKERTKTRRSNESAILWKSPQTAKTTENDGNFVNERQNPGVKTVRAMMFDHNVERHTVSASRLKAEADESVEKVRKIPPEDEKFQKTRFDDDEEDPLRYQRIEPRYEILQTVGERVRSEAVATVPEDKAVTLRSRKTTRERHKTDGGIGVIWARHLEFQAEPKAKDLEDGVAREVMDGKKKSWGGQHVAASARTNQEEKRKTVETENEKVDENTRPLFRMNWNKDREQTEEKTTRISVETENEKSVNNTRTPYCKDWEEKTTRISVEMENEKFVDNTKMSYRKDWERTEDKTSTIPIDITNEKSVNNTRMSYRQDWERMEDKTSTISVDLTNEKAANLMRTSREKDWERTKEKMSRIPVEMPNEKAINHPRMSRDKDWERTEEKTSKSPVEILNEKAVNHPRMSRGKNWEQTVEKTTRILAETENEKVGDNTRTPYRTSREKDWERTVEIPNEKAVDNTRMLSRMNQNWEQTEKTSTILVEISNEKITDNTRTPYRTKSGDWEQTEEKTSTIPVGKTNEKTVNNTRDVPATPKGFLGCSGTERGRKDGNDPQLTTSVTGVRMNQWQRDGEMRKDESRVIVIPGGAERDESQVVVTGMNKADERAWKSNERVVVIAEGFELKEIDERAKRNTPKPVERWRRKTLPHDAVRFEDVVTTPQERGKSPVRRDSFQPWESAVVKKSPKEEANDVVSPSESKLTNLSNRNVPPKIPRPHHKRFSSMNEGEPVAAAVATKSPQTETRVTDVDFPIYGSRTKSLSSQKSPEQRHLGKDGYRSRVLDLDALMAEYKENSNQGQREAETEKWPYSADEKIRYSADGKLHYSADGKLQYLADEKLRNPTDEKLQYSADKISQFSTDEKLRHSTFEKSRHSTDEKLQYFIDEKLRYFADEKLRYSENEKLRLSANEKLQHSTDEKLRYFADEKLRYSENEKLRLSANEKLQHSTDEKLRYFADEKLRHSTDEKLRHSTDEKSRHSTDKILQYFTDEKLQLSIDEKLQYSTDEKLQYSTVEKSQHSTDEKLRYSADEELQYFTDEKLQYSIDEKLRLSADGKLRYSADEKLQPSEDEKLRYSVDEKLRYSIDEKLRHSTFEKSRHSIDEKSRYSADEKLQHSRDEKFKYSADEKLQYFTDEKSRHSAVEKSQHSPDEKLKFSTNEKLRYSAEEKLRHSADEKLRYSADEKLRYFTDEKLRHSADEKLRYFTDEKLRHSADEKLRYFADPRMSGKKTFLVDEESLVPPQSRPSWSRKVGSEVNEPLMDRRNVNDENKSMLGSANALPDLRRSFSEKARKSGSRGRGSPLHPAERGNEIEKRSVSPPHEEKKMDQRRSRSFYRERKTDHWPTDQLRQCFIRPSTGAKDTDNLVPEADNNQYGTWEQRGSSDNLPSTSSSLHMEQKLDGIENTRINDFSFLDPVPVLDSSALKSRVHLSKRRRQRRAPISLSLRRSRSREEEVEQEVEGPPTAPPQRLPPFPGMDPAALKVQLRKRQETEGNRGGGGGGVDGAVPAQTASRWKEERSEEVPPQWLKELKSKRRLSQWENPRLNHVSCLFPGRRSLNFPLECLFKPEEEEEMGKKPGLPVKTGSDSAAGPLEDNGGIANWNFILILILFFLHKGEKDE